MVDLRDIGDGDELDACESHSDYGVDLRTVGQADGDEDLVCCNEDSIISNCSDLGYRYLSCIKCRYYATAHFI